MRSRSRILCVLALAAAVAVAGPARADRLSWGPDSPYQLDPALDVGLLAIGLPTWLLPHYFDDQLAPPTCGQPGHLCDPSTIPWFDRPFRYGNESLRAPSELLFNYAPVVMLAGLFFDYGPARWRGFLTDAVIIVEAWAWAGAITHLLRYAVRRPRPYLYDGDYPAQRNADATMGFPSGHVSELVGFGVSYALLVTLRRGASWRTGVVWAVVIAASTAIAILRVGSGDHFPSDVVVGGAVGTGAGLIVPWLHRRRVGPLSSLSLVPVASDDYAGVALGARF